MESKADSRQGLEDVENYVRSSIDLNVRFKTAGLPTSNLPLVVWIYEAESDSPNVLGPADISTYHRCYFWLFGYVVKLPIERDVNIGANGMPIVAR